MRLLPDDGDDPALQPCIKPLHRFTALHHEKLAHVEKVVFLGISASTCRNQRKNARGPEKDDGQSGHRNQRSGGEQREQRQPLPRRISQRVADNEVGRRADERADTAEKGGESQRHQHGAAVKSTRIRQGKDHRQQQGHGADIVHDGGEHSARDAQAGQKPGRAQAQPGQPLPEADDNLAAVQSLDDQQHRNNSDDRRMGKTGKGCAGGNKARHTGKAKPGERNSLDTPAVEHKHGQHAAEKRQKKSLIKRHAAPAAILSGCSTAATLAGPGRKPKPGERD